MHAPRGRGSRFPSCGAWAQEEKRPVRLVACGPHSTVVVTHGGNVWLAGRSFFDPKVIPADMTAVKR